MINCPSLPAWDKDIQPREGGLRSDVPDTVSGVLSQWTEDTQPRASESIAAVWFDKNAYVREAVSKIDSAEMISPAVPLNEQERAVAIRFISDFVEFYLANGLTPPAVTEVSCYSKMHINGTIKWHPYKFAGNARTWPVLMVPHELAGRQDVHFLFDECDGRIFEVNQGLVSQTLEWEMREGNSRS